MHITPISIRVFAHRNGLKKRIQYYNINNNYFSSINSEDKAYFLGFIFADGNVRKNGLKIFIHNKDRDILEKFKDFLQCNKDFKETERYDHQKYIEFNIYSNELIEDLKKLGVIENKSLISIFPDIDSSLVRHYIRGYFDGDGWISKINTSKWNGYQFGICSGSYNMLNEIYKKLKKITPINFHILKKKNSNCFKITTTNKRNLNDIWKFLYQDATVYGNRKKNIFDEAIL